MGGNIEAFPLDIEKMCSLCPISVNIVYKILANEIKQEKILET